MIAIAYAPQPEVARWVDFHDYQLKVYSNARSLTANDCKAVIDSFARSGRSPQLFQDNTAGYRNTTLTWNHPDSRVVLVDENWGVSDVDTSQKNIQDVTALLEVAHTENASRLYVLTMSPPPTRQAEIQGQCRGCVPGQGFLHIPEGTSDCLLHLQCHGCGWKLEPLSIHIARYSWHMQMQIGEGASGVCEDFEVPIHRATNSLGQVADLKYPEIYQIPRLPGDFICQLNITLQANFEATPCFQAVDPSRVSLGAIIQPLSVFGAAGGQIALGRPPQQAPERVPPGMRFGHAFISRSN